jgi:hypothetical protein
VHSLIQEFAVIARQVHASDDFDDSLARITATVVHAVGGCESASITLINQAGPVTRGDRPHAGPCSGPSMAPVDRTAVSTARCPKHVLLPAHPGRGPEPDTRRDEPLRHQTPGVRDPGPGCWPSCCRPWGVVIDAARQQEQLRAAIASRQVIGEVVGILRAQSDLSSAQALEMLSRASRRTQPNSGISPSRSRTGPEQGASPSDSPSPAPRTRRRPYPPTGASKGATRATTAGPTNAGPAHSDVLRHHTGCPRQDSNLRHTV